MSWKRLNQRDCPVCNGLRNDCRQSLTTHQIHCRHLEARPVQYLFRKYDALGFGVWANRAELEQWKEEHSRESRQQVTNKFSVTQAPNGGQLSDAQRDLVIEDILSQLELSREHREALLKRGLSIESIEAGKYRTVNPWQKLTLKVDSKLAGVQENGKGLTVPARGILCPIANQKGELVGWQIRLDEPTRGERPKYLWAASKSQTGSDIARVHLKNGELPLAYCESATSSIHPVILKELKNNPKLLPIALSEGVSFKPAITAQRLGIHSIGASGGNFASSPQTLQSYLDHIQRQHNERKIIPILFADAGALSNPSILKVYENTFSKLREMGYQLKIAWWSQSEKSIGDIDEIDEQTLSSLRIISYRDFVILAKKKQYYQQLNQSQEILQNFSQQPNIQLNSRYLPDLSNLAQYQGLVALKSPKGTGKSIQIKQIIKAAKELGKKIISLTPRRALGREQSLKWEINWIGDSEIDRINPQTVIENLDSIGLCWDSLWKLAQRDWSNTIIIIDEVETALVHLMMSATCREKRPLILKVLEDKFRESLTNGGMILIADADLANPSIEYFQALAPNNPTYIISNDYQGKELQYNIGFHTGRKDDLVSQLISELAIPVSYIDRTGQTNQRNKKIAIPIDSKDDGIALKRLIEQHYPCLKILEINSITTETPQGRQIVEQPNQKIAELEPDILIYTPSMGIGISIDLDYFDKMYAFFTGVLQPNQCRQMLGRIRQTIPREIWCRAQGHNKGYISFSAEENQSRLLQHSQESSVLSDVVSMMLTPEATDQAKLRAYNQIFDTQEGTWQNHHIKLYSKLKARKDFGLHYLAHELRRQLAIEGHIINDYHCGKKNQEGEKLEALKKSLAREQAQAIVQAKDITLEEAQFLNQKSKTTILQRQQITKAFLHAELPGIKITPDFVYKAITKDCRRWLNQQKLYWYLQNYEVTKILDSREWQTQLGNFSQGVMFLPDVKTYGVEVKLLKDLGILELIDPSNIEHEYSNRDLLIKKILLRAKKRAKHLRYCFNLKISEKTKAIQLINHLLKQIGLNLKYHHQSSKGERYYRLDRTKIEDLDRLAVLKALNTKWSNLQSKSNSLRCGEPISFENQEKLETISHILDKKEIKNSS